MLAVNLNNLKLDLYARHILTKVDWEIHDDRCVGLTGANGAGKSSLLKLIAGEIPPDGGSITRAKGLTIGYLQQDPALDPDKTALNETLSASAELHALEKDLLIIEHKLSDPAIYGNAKALERTLETQQRLLERYEELGGLNYEKRVRDTLRGLGLDETDFDNKVANLSGGQKKLVGLAKLLITQPSLLLLDEPDNHLDLNGKAFLERTINDYHGTVVIVSHDRYLLDHVVDEIAELEAGRITTWPGTYSEYAFEKQMRLARQQQLYDVQQREIGRLQAAAKQLLMWGRQYDNEKFIKRGKAILGRIEKIDKLERPVLEPKRMDLQINGWRGSNKVLEILHLAKIFASTEPLFTDLNILIRHGERVGLVGPNGAGKSVLLKMILGDVPIDRGEIVVGPSIAIGYYAQQHETLERDQTLIDLIRHAKECSEGAAVAFLLKFLFTYEQCRQRIGDLSGGERSRLQLALLMLSGANFLLLDEPTNNLDIASAEVLENALQNFEGTVLCVSHDRYFLDRITNRTVELDNGYLTDYVGGYSDYAAKKLGKSG
ncbi:MAG TPA: ABC-F family ATP-binding cassette domain-containing protein [Anaerolineae bacterium]|nr:ABC-F family ATP-binding cassette domain-containing protein [Anaerolineae bacterium]